MRALLLLEPFHGAEAWETFLAKTKAKKALSASAPSVSAVMNPFSSFSSMCLVQPFTANTVAEALHLALGVACSPHQLQVSFAFPKHRPACSGHLSQFLLPSLSLLPPPDRCVRAPTCDPFLRQHSPTAQHMLPRPPSLDTAQDRVCLGWGNVPHQSPHSRPQCPSPAALLLLQPPSAWPQPSPNRVPHKGSQTALLWGLPRSG